MGQECSRYHSHLAELIVLMKGEQYANAPINVKPEGEGGGADVGHLTFCEIFFSNSPP